MKRFKRAASALVMMTAMVVGISVLQVPAEAGVSPRVVSNVDAVKNAENAALAKGLAHGVHDTRAKHVQQFNGIVAVDNGGGGAIGLMTPKGSVVRSLSAKGAARIINPVLWNGDGSYTYDLILPDMGVARLEKNGSVSLLIGRKVIGSIAKPWALDAQRNVVPTEFVLNGKVLTQRVDPLPHSTYPIVSDPAIYLKQGWVTSSWYLSKYWTKRIADKVARYANATNAAIAGAFALACAPISGPGAIVCGAVGAVLGGFAIDQFMEARKRGVCIRIRVPRTQITTPLGIYVDGTSNCKAY
jgi:hypothetical protein